MNNLIVTLVKYRGYLFTASPAMLENTDKFWFFSLKEFDRYHVETKKNITKYAFRHGSKVGATSNGVRTFNMTFTAFASDEIERMKLIRLVSSIFNPPSIMSDTEGFHELEFMTPDGGWRTTKAQVIDRPKIFDFNNENWATFQVELVGKDGSLLYSKNKTLFGGRNTRMGVKLPFSLSHRHKYYNPPIHYHGTNDAPLRIELRAMKQVTLPRLYIRSYSGEELLTTMELDSMQLNTGDRIVIDGHEETIRKISGEEKTDLSNQISLNSEWPRLLSPLANKDVSVVVDCGLNEEMILVEGSYNEIWD